MGNCHRMDNYKEIEELLKPRRDIKASDELRLKVIRAVDRSKRRKEVRKWIFGGISLSAVAAVLILLLIPFGLSAKEILAEAINALGAEDIEMVVEVRTRPVENFGYIDVKEDFVTHHIFISSSDSLLRWRIDKGERIATGNGTDIYTWMRALKLGWHLSERDREKTLGYMATLLTPRKILETELYNCIGSKSAEYTVNRSGDDIILTVHDMPQGNFDNPYRLNTSVAESENIRRYVIDADSNRLKSASVSVISGSREIPVLKIISINYGRHRNEICRLDDGIRYVETENQPVGLGGLSAEEAATTILNAFTNWDEAILDKVMMQEVADVAYRKKFCGARLISIGHSFTSGTGNSIFVPYTLELRDGTMQRHNIAMQKTDSGGWVVAGGL